MRLQVFIFFLWAGFSLTTAEAVEDTHTEEKEAIVRSLRKLQKSRPELKEVLSGLEYLEQGVRIQTSFSGKDANTFYELPLSNAIAKSIEKTLNTYKEGTINQESERAKSPNSPNSLRFLVFRNRVSRDEEKTIVDNQIFPQPPEITREKSLPLKGSVDFKKMLFRKKSGDLREEKGKKESLDPDPSSPAVEIVHPDLKQAPEEKKQDGFFISEIKNTPPPKRREDSKRVFAFKQKSDTPQKKREERKSLDPNPSPPAVEIVRPDLKQAPEEKEDFFISEIKNTPPPKRREDSKRESAATPQRERLEKKPSTFAFETSEKKKQDGFFTLGLEKSPATLTKLFDAHLQIAAEKKAEETQRLPYFEHSDPSGEFKQIIRETASAAVYIPVLLPIVGEETLSPLVFVLGTFNQVFFARFPVQPIHLRWGKVAPVVCSRLDCLYAWEFIEHLNGFQQPPLKSEFLFNLDFQASVDEMLQNMEPVFNLSFEIQHAILDLAATAPAETLEKIGTSLYVALYDSLPYALSLQDFQKPRQLLEYLESLAKNWLATSTLFNPEKMSERFEFQGIPKRRIVLETLNHTAKRFKKPPFDHDPGRFETLGFLKAYILELRQEAESWVTSGFGSLTQAFEKRGGIK
jgi:hypothetical protein